MNNRRETQAPGSSPVVGHRHFAGPARSRARIASCLFVILLRRGGVAAQNDGGDDVSGSASSAAELYPDCEGNSTMIGDATCDIDNNVASCGFDGGDCCECTCVDTGDHACGEGGAGYLCLDPDAPDDCGLSPAPISLSSEATTTASPSSSEAATYPGCGGYIPHIGDGYCDEINNVAACDFDGGDCCACTCGEGLEHVCGAFEDFDCRDPDVPDDCNSAGFALCEGYMGYSWQNGYCDEELNTEICGYDGGDCCPCTCREYLYAQYSSISFSGYDFRYCGLNGYDCVDPEAPTTCATDSPTPSPAMGTEYPECEGNISYIGDGWCDYYNNTEECAWDGGDCCACTCLSGAYSCGSSGYDCLDPSVSTDCTTTSDYGTYYYGTYTPPDYYGTYTYATRYDTYATSEEAYCSDNGNGRCDSNNNNANCGWDWGDCCECDCVSGDIQCGTYGYDCLDPASTCPSNPTPSPSLTSTSINTGQVVFGFSLAVVGFCVFGGAMFAACSKIRNKMAEKADGQDSDGSAAVAATTGARPPEPEGPAIPTTAVDPATTTSPPIEAEGAAIPTTAVDPATTTSPPIEAEGAAIPTTAVDSATTGSPPIEAEGAAIPTTAVDSAPPSADK